jgi:sugar phosphate isomerase/epimerase
MRPKAKQLIEFAIKHKLDSILLNNLTYFESLETEHLTRLTELANDNDISIYTGAGSICTAAGGFSDRFGDPGAILAEGIRVASTVGSPIVGVRIGNIDDRYSNGGIRPKIDEVVKVMKSMKGPALDAGIKFAFENHAGDLRSGELLELIEETGTDICGALYDPGNAIWALEDPMRALEILGSNILCTSARDVMVWPAEDGAFFQWTAMGEGLMDYKVYTKFMSENCPGVPIHIETISNSRRPIPFLTPDFWDGFPELHARDILDFLNLLRQGHALEVEKPPPGTDSKEFEIKHQQNEFLKSVAYLRTECGAGLKS